MGFFLQKMKWDKHLKTIVYIYHPNVDRLYLNKRFLCYKSM